MLGWGLGLGAVAGAGAGLLGLVSRLEPFYLKLGEFCDWKLL